MLAAGCRQGFAVAEQQLELPRGWLACAPAQPGRPVENGHANGTNGSAAVPALHVAHEGDAVVVTGPSLRAQARLLEFRVSCLVIFWILSVIISVCSAVAPALQHTRGIWLSLSPASTHRHAH